ncbi:hypothetical protein LINPERPRIM_LOCUS25874, partial [Linum perenne]
SGRSNLSRVEFKTLWEYKIRFFLLAPHFLFTSPSPFPKPVFEEPKKNPLASILDSGSCRAPIGDPFVATGSW